MNSKLYIVFALCIYQVSATAYDDAFKKCKQEHGLTDDKPLDHFLEKGEFPSGYEHLKCFFSCLTSSLKINDANDNLDGAKVQEQAKQNPDKPELQLFANDDVLKACLPSKDQSSVCAKAISFVQCALEVKATQKPSA